MAFNWILVVGWVIRAAMQNKRQKIYRIALLLVLPFFFMSSISALAHPLGDFVVNRYARLALGSDAIHIIYAVDIAEITTVQEKIYMDRDGDKQFSEAEKEAYLNDRLVEYTKNLHLLVDNSRVQIEPLESSVTFAPGDGGLETMYILAHFVAPLPAKSGPWQVEFLDDTYSDRLGWQEVVIETGEAVTLLESSAPTEELSRMLTHYPEGMTDYRVNHALIRFEPIELSAAGQQSVVVLPVTNLPSGAVDISKTADPFADLLNQTFSSPGSIAVGLLLALFWGALHALSPGHGKTIVAAYLVGSRGTVTHALYLGLITTVTHTVGVFALGVVTLLASSYILPEQIYPWLGVISGLLVMGIGLTLARGYINRFRLAGAIHEHSHEHEHNHDHEHSHEHGYHSHGGGPVHRHVVPDDRPMTWRSLLALGVSGGLIPCPSALIVMLGAIALGRIGLGLVLIVMFSVGLAGVLVTMGILWVKAADWLNTLSKSVGISNKLPFGDRLFHLLPAASAAFIVIVGVGITVRALFQTGIIGS